MIKSEIHLQKTLQWSLLLDHEHDFDPLIFYDSKLHLLLFLYPKNFKVLPLSNKTLKIPSRIFYPPSFLHESLICHLDKPKPPPKSSEFPPSQLSDQADLLFFDKGNSGFSAKLCPDSC